MPKSGADGTIKWRHLGSNYSGPYDVLDSSSSSSDDKSIIFVLPGVPSEMKIMFNNYIPWI